MIDRRPRYVVGDTTAAELKAVTAPLESETSSASGEG
jgi:hypothetical protein